MFPIITCSIIYIFSIFNLFKTGFCDPGILERQFYYNTDLEKKKIKCVINGHIHELNYCISCHIIKPPRCSHCAICDNCINRFDHHCYWMGNCIGKRNYKFFYYLLLSLILNCFFQIIYSISIIIFQASNKKNRNKENKCIVYIIFSGILFYEIIFLTFFLMKLFIIQSWLLLTNTTFYEHHKKKWKKIPNFNPFNLFFGYHSCRLLCYKSNKTYLNLKKNKLKKMKIKNKILDIEDESTSKYRL